MTDKEANTPLAKNYDNQLLPVQPKLLKRLWFGIICSFIFITWSLMSGFLRKDFDSLQQSLSALSLGADGWQQATAFICIGLVVIFTCPAWRNIFTGHKGAKTFTVLTCFTGISVILCGVFDQDPAPGYDPERLSPASPTLHGLLHLLFAAIGALCSIISLIIASGFFAQKLQWHGWKTYTLCAAFVMTTCIALYAVYSTNSTGYAGLFERAGFMVVPVWTFTLVVRLETGVPFMKKV